MIYSFQSPELIAHDVEQLGLAAVIADRENWTAPVIAAAERSGSAGVAISLQPPTVELIVGLDRTGANRQHAAFDGTARAARPHQRNHRPAEAPGDTRERIGAHRLQRDGWKRVAG